MALCLNVFSLPNEHIQFLKHNPQTMQVYLVGQIPELEAVVAIKQQSILTQLVRLIRGGKALVLPQDWPQHQVEMIGPDINHRNVDLYHYILNDTEELVRGAGSIFQTWLDINHHDAIKMDRSNESFAFESHRLAELAILLSKLDEQTVRNRFNAWLLEHNPDYIPQESEYLEMFTGWQRFKAGIAKAVEQNWGLVWVTQ
ncbi:hypothetical protein L2719_09750 [Shewanella schlegeliana]|uniref:Uncharacterized protein n=1 Tax=Shewanella schlegeliana TaxID=190308 RepID=A0ABS1SYQ7_9GAMM|nr:hypothetical protein [Shewanella schlegeliana]MBL4912662.1 hypothetical protein [Shewanella schlegeliana]MCL1109828.1 hypothetical protein [Shewanella schlegeliana]GIU32826.1 hypothetical protein TUM4433_26360 [Shewanella schlegeliana]